jgi:hypothetical protein
MPLSIHVFKDARIAYLPNTFTGHVAGLNRAGHGFDHHHSILEALKHCTTVISHGMEEGSTSI